MDDDYSNLAKAVVIVATQNELRGVQAALRAAFARDELDGGWKTALTHPLYVQAQERIEHLDQELKILI